MESTETFIRQQNSDNTKRAYRQDLDYWYSWLGDREISEARLLEFRDHLEANASNNTAVRRWNTVRTFYKWSGSDVFDRIKGPRRVQNWTPHAPSDSEVDNLINSCDNPRDRAIIALLANGLRAQEVCDLRTEDLMFVEGSDAWVLRVTGKGQKLRFVPLNREAVDCLEAYRGDRDGRMFPKLNIRAIYYLTKEKHARYGINPHGLRHNYATRMVRRKVDIFSVQKLLGHSRADTTSVYVNLDLEDLIRVAQTDTRG